MKKVIIMLAAYNGEKYIADQIESILAQTFTNILLLVRDDASSDNTVEQIKKFSMQDERVILLRDEMGNIGPCKCFEALISYALKHYPNEVYMFSDHDDYWFSNKIENELKILEEDKPCLIYSNYEITDNKLNKISIAYDKPFKFTMDDYKRRIILQNWIMGCTMMINYELLKLSYPISNAADNHDQYIASLASYVGNIIYLDEITVKHRIHSNNVTTKTKTTTFLNRIVRNFAKIINRKAYFSKTIDYLNDLISNLKNQNRINDIDLIEKLLVAYKSRGKVGCKILKENRFLMFTEVQNKLLRMQFRLK